MATESEQLDKLRAQIDALDQQILDRLNERINVAKKIGSVKNKRVVYRPEREAKMLRALVKNNPGPLPNERIEAIFREIISSSYQHESPLNVATLGPEGTYSQMALRRKFGTGVRESLFRSIDEVFRVVVAQECAYGLVPVENSLEGSVGRTLDCFWNSDISICGEIALPIHHKLLVSENTTLEAIDKVYGHGQALGQSRQWLDTNLPNVARIAVDSSGDAVARVLEDKKAAAVAGELAQQTSGLQSMAENIEDLAGNTTRFLVIGKQDVPPSGEDKTTVCVQIHDRPGELLKMLQPFEKHGIDMNRIESRPLRLEPWSYLFFIDCMGHREDPTVSKVLDEIENIAVRFKWLGSYPRHVE